MENALRKGLQEEREALDLFEDYVKRACAAVAAFVGASFDAICQPNNVFWILNRETPWVHIDWEIGNQHVVFEIQAVDVGPILQCVFGLQPVLCHFDFDTGQMTFHRNWETKAYSAAEGAEICSVVCEHVRLAQADQIAKC